jgi:hypothetical protein
MLWEDDALVTSMKNKARKESLLLQGMIIFKRTTVIDTPHGRQHRKPVYY